MKELINKTVNKIFMDENYLTFEVDNGETITYATSGDCCSESVWYDFYGVKELFGKKVNAVTNVELTDDDFLAKRLRAKDSKNYQESIEIYGVAISFEGKWGERTATVSFRNYSNGYYGGSYYLVNGDKRSTNEITDDVIETSSITTPNHPHVTV